MAFSIARYEVHTWVNKETFTPIYGIRARIVREDGKREWRHVAENGKPLFFDTAEEASAKIKTLN